jgi:hypothetical protein
VTLQKPDFSEYRRETIILYLQAAGLTTRLNTEALTLLVVGMLLADDTGSFSEQSLLVAMSDPSTLQVAKTLIKKAQDAV